MTPYYSEETVYSKFDLEMENEDGISIIYYLQKIFPDEWTNFLERLTCKNESEVWENDENILQLRHWVSLRGQTLCRTGNLMQFFSLPISLHFPPELKDIGGAVRGMMYYCRALKLQAFLDMADETGKTKIAFGILGDNISSI
ncbi:Callose synthase 5 [Sarracenia purpurea var. burkii]